MTDQIQIGGKKDEQAPRISDANHIRIHAPSPSLAAQPLLHQRYRLLHRLGEGAAGVVYEARDLAQHNRRVALKLIDVQNLSVSQAIERVETFHREVSALSALKHPGIPSLYDHFSDAHYWYLIMEYVEGENLEQYVIKQEAATGSGSIPVMEVLAIGILLCDILAYLHAADPPIVFRDLKPGNIMRQTDGTLLFIDFGIARRYRAGKVRDTIPLGTPGFAAPEQYGTAQTTPKADIYSLGALFHHLLTGDDPTLTPFHFAPLHFTPHPALVALESLLSQMLEHDPEKRPASAHQIQQQLYQILLQLSAWPDIEKNVSSPLEKKSRRSRKPESDATIKQAQHLMRSGEKLAVYSLLFDMLALFFSPFAFPLRNALGLPGDSGLTGLMTSMLIGMGLAVGGVICAHLAWNKKHTRKVRILALLGLCIGYLIIFVLFSLWLLLSSANLE